MTSHSRAVSGLLIGRSPAELSAAPRNRSIRRRVIARETAPSPAHHSPQGARSARRCRRPWRGSRRRPACRASETRTRSSPALVSATTSWSGCSLRMLPGGEDPVEPGHDDVHHARRRAGSAEPELDRLATVLGLGDHGHPVRLERGLDHAPGVWIVIHDDHAHRRDCCHPCFTPSASLLSEKRRSICFSQCTRITRETAFVLNLAD